MVLGFSRLCGCRGPSCGVSALLPSTGIFQSGLNGEAGDVLEHWDFCSEQSIGGLQPLCPCWGRQEAGRDAVCVVVRCSLGSGFAPGIYLDCFMHKKAGGKVEEVSAAVRCLFTKGIRDE